MQERLIGLAKELDKLAKERKVGICINVSRYDWSKPRIQIVSHIEKPCDMDKPYETVYLDNIVNESNGVILTSSGFYYQNVEGEAEK